MVSKSSMFFTLKIWGALSAYWWPRPHEVSLALSTLLHVPRILLLVFQFFRKMGQKRRANSCVSGESVWKQGHPCHALETNWERKLKYPGKSWTPASEAGHVSWRRPNMGSHKGKICNSRILGKRSGVFICFMSLWTWEVWEAWVLWEADLPDQWVGVSPQVLNLMVSARGQTLGHQQPGKELLFPWKDPDICIFYINFFVVVVSSSVVWVSRFLLKLL